MNISYNWLKDYVNFDLSPEELSAALTSIGLETGGIEEVQTIKGGLNGLVIGKVLTCEDHPNSDHLHITTVDLGESEPVQIVCGAANVAAGQYVVVATLGTVFRGCGLGIWSVNRLWRKRSDCSCRSGIFRYDLCRRRNRYRNFARWHYRVAGRGKTRYTGQRLL